MFRSGSIAAWLFAALLLSPVAASAQHDAGAYNQQSNTADPTGLWITANHNAVVDISKCGTDLCGRIVGLVRDPGTPAPTDWQGAPQCGLTIFRTAPDPDSTQDIWNGSILDPRDGSVYHARLTLDQAHHLLLRGYVGIPLFGETQTWSRYTGPTGPECEVPLKATN
jgi:uncharacterized protein (DUF2147 family)